MGRRVAAAAAAVVASLCAQRLIGRIESSQRVAPVKLRMRRGRASASQPRAQMCTATRPLLPAWSHSGGALDLVGAEGIVQSEMHRPHC